MWADKIRLFALYFPAFLFGLACHEAAHGLVAYRLGDATAKERGRLTLNPFPHMDLFGTVLLPLAVWFTPGSLPIGGWGKPVPVNYQNLRNPRRDGMWIALAGPLSNLALAVASALLLRLMFWFLDSSSQFSFTQAPFFLEVADPLLGLVEASVWINLGLAVFNMIPVHPLDGGKVLMGLLPLHWALAYDRFARYGVLVVVVLFYAGGFRYLHYPVERIAHVLIPS
jgi:Zn-dependent protease